MRDRTEIEHEIFDARQDLEQSLSDLEHKVREKTEVRARAMHGLEQLLQRHGRTIAIVAAGVVALWLLRRLRSA